MSKVPEGPERNHVVRRLRSIYCCQGADFCRPELEMAWKEIWRLEGDASALAAAIEHALHVTSLGTPGATAINEIRESLGEVLAGFKAAENKPATGSETT